MVNSRTNRIIEIGNWVFHKINENKYEAIDCYGQIEKVSQENVDEDIWEFRIFESIKIRDTFENVSSYIKNQSTNI
jgi:pantothenate kinase